MLTLLKAWKDHLQGSGMPLHHLHPSSGLLLLISILLLLEQWLSCPSPGVSSGPFPWTQEHAASGILPYPRVSPHPQTESQFNTQLMSVPPHWDLSQLCSCSGMKSCAEGPRCQAIFRALSFIHLSAEHLSELRLPDRPRQSALR